MLYLDTSAFLKSFLDEPETFDLRHFLVARPQRLSSSLLRVEAGRAFRRAGGGNAHTLEQALERLTLVAVATPILELAAKLDPPGLSSLDAIHLATALIHSAPIQFVTYDRRLADAARLAGLVVRSPGAEV